MLDEEHVPAKKVASFFACSRRDVYRVVANEKRDDVLEDAKWLEQWDALVTDVDVSDIIAHATSSSLDEDLSSLQEDCKLSLSEVDDEALDNGSESQPSEDHQEPRITDAAIASGWYLRRSARLRRDPAQGTSSSLVHQALPAHSHIAEISDVSIRRDPSSASTPPQRTAKNTSSATSSCTPEGGETDYPPWLRLSSLTPVPEFPQQHSSSTHTEQDRPMNPASQRQEAGEGAVKKDPAAQSHPDEVCGSPVKRKCDAPPSTPDDSVEQ